MLKFPKIFSSLGLFNSFLTNAMANLISLQHLSTFYFVISTVTITFMNEMWITMVFKSKFTITLLAKYGTFQYFVCITNLIFVCFTSCMSMMECRDMPFIISIKVCCFENSFCFAAVPDDFFAWYKCSFFSQFAASSTWLLDK